jgi:hypothetical protein
MLLSYSSSSVLVPISLKYCSTTVHYTCSSTWCSTQTNFVLDVGIVLIVSILQRNTPYYY